MASKVMVKIPVAPFGQVNKAKQGGEQLVSVSCPGSISNGNVEQNRSSDAVRVAQLEQNIRFLQEQHQLMLSGLHKEIDNLRHRNRELQFQLVFVKGSVPSSDSSSSEDDTKHKVYTSPKSPNVTPLQVEILEKELGELKLHLNQVEHENQYLTAIIDEQKRKLDNFERERDKTTQPDSDLLRKLDDTEALVRKLHQENSELRRENSSSSSHYQHRDAYFNRNTRGGGGLDQNRSNGRNRGGNYKGNWFPPLHSQNYWQGGRGVDRGTSQGETSFPSLQGNNGGSPGHYQARRNPNNNHHRSGDGRKYRGGHSNRGGKQT